MAKPKVAILRTNPTHVLDDMVKLFELGEGNRHLESNTTTILKDNISWHYPFPSANTTPWQLEGTIKALKKHGYNDIACVENKTEVTKTHKGEKLNFYTPVLSAHNIDILFNFKKDDMKWIHFEPKSKMLVLNKIYKNDIRIPDYFIGKNIIHLPTVKCHIYTTTTGALKNAFGGLLNHKRHQTHTYIHETLVDLLSIQKEIHPGIFCIMDGTTAGNGTGPRIMKPVQKNVILASADQVAIDAVAAKIMGFDPMQIKYLNLAHEMGLGTAKPEEIEVVGDTEIINENWGFKVGFCFHTFAGWFTWFGPTKFLQGLLTRPPLLYFGNFYSFFYHDILHWPLKEKRIYKKWLQESEWGRLFEQYRSYP
ncbi:DUF362 domain-containing protein [bacterium]|nr:DUF362 domain-containing protein [bacterium]RQV95731.1 MAG: DUF362 domain-containing protein [bacterium]